MKARAASPPCQTAETDIQAGINRDGPGRYKVSTGIHFLDYMPELFARRGGFDLELRARDDLDRTSTVPWKTSASCSGSRFARRPETNEASTGPDIS
jgi:hypothetical protein